MGTLWRLSFVSLALMPASLASLFWSNYENCPQACNVVGQEPRNWTHYHTISDLDWCKEPMLFDLGLHTPVNQPDTHITIRACTVTGSGPARIHSSDTTTWESPAPSLKHNSVDVRLVWGRPADIDGQDVVRATENLIRYLKTEASCAASKIMFAQSGKTAVGLYVGSQIERASAAAIVQDSFVARVKANQVPSRIGAQICGDQPFSAQTFGIYADLRGNISAIQDIVRDWSTGKCLSQYDQEEVQKGKSVGIISALMDAPSRDSRGDDERKRELQHRATCKYTQADPGDGCWALAQKCEISQDDLIKYNGGKSNFCNTIISGQYVCCGTGSLPDFSPQPNPDGSCASYTAQASDTCAVIAAANQISDYKKPEEYNKNTWGWTGCNKGLQPGQLICLSKGDPPMPNPLSGATCGPQVPGRERPTNGTKLADLNPCPLNVCCNIWGNCGLSDEFCIESPADSGAPGAAKPGSNGCISNCGMDIVHSDKKPDQFRRVGYFESWNIKDRECLHMDVSKIPEVAPVGESGYTHIHFAFPDITSELTVDVSKYQDQFDGFKKLSSVKKIVSFGGWEFSNTAESYAVFRIMVSSEANRQKAARNVIRFLKDHNLDGLDFDWEYPGATDIPGTPAGSHDEGENYLKFLKTVRNSLPEGKTLSIAAPSSFWYLKNFPIKAMSEVLDYIIFMTYDLHGQWDVENKWTSPGCPTGNCLRHHVNETEVNLALALITKAGVPSHKVVVGMPFYGRSFKMAQEGCTGPDCFFLGDKMNSQPAKGECTDTAGYISNVEISAIRNSNSDPDLYGSRMIEEIEDKVGDILVYDDTEWVSWMTPKTYLVRSVEYSVGNFGGTSDWAIDLNNDFADGGKGEDYRDIDAGEDSGCDFSRTFKDLEDLNNNADGLRLYCRQVYALQVLDKMMDDLYNEYKRVDNGYDSKFDAYTRYIDRITPYAITNFMIKGLEYFDCYRDPEFMLPETRHCLDFSSDERNQGSFDMTLTLRDREGFFTALLNETGIIEEWINFDGHRRDIGYCTVEGAGVCPPDTGVRDWFGLPQKNDEIEVADPRDIVTEGLGNLEEIQTILRSTMFEIMLGIWDGSIDDVVQVMSVPVFMLAEAVEGMKEAKQLGEEQEKWEEEEARRKAKDLILTIVGAVLFVVPFVGEVGAMLAGATTLARIALIAGETANLAFGIYGMVDDPDSALMGVLGMMFGLGGVTRVGRTPKGFKDMAAKRAGLRTDGGVSKIGGNFQKRDDMLQDIVNFCRT